MASCTSMCVDGDEPSTVQSCSGMGCCKAPIVVNRKVVDGNKLVNITSYDVELTHFGWNQTVDNKWPARVFVTLRDLLDPCQPSKRLMETQASFVLDWEILISGRGRNTNPHECYPDVARNVCKSNYSDCFRGTRGGYVCLWESGFVGNPYLPHGCQGFSSCSSVSFEGSWICT